MAKLVQGVNDLATCRPDLAKEWDTEKNGRGPETCALHSNKKVWWRCPKGHSYLCMVNDRVNENSGCHYCSGRKILPGDNDFATIHPELIPEWDFEKNTVDPTRVSKSNGVKVWWKCPEGHSYEASISHRVNMKSGCPYCANKKALEGYNDLASIFPEIAAEWDYEKNGSLTPNKVTSKSQRSVWWKCSECGHEWKTTVGHRTTEHTGCPMCKKASKGEWYIAKKLDEAGIKYETQKTFDDCKNQFLLSYDFYIEEAGLLIEFDGRQHFEPVEIFGGEKEFQKQKARDQVKDEYVSREGKDLLLIRVPYHDLVCMDKVMEAIFTFYKILKEDKEHGCSRNDV